MRRTIHINIRGMTCPNCQDRISRTLNKTKGILQASVSYENSSAEVIFNPSRISFQQIADIVNLLGYSIPSKRYLLLHRIFILAAVAAIFFLRALRRHVRRT